MKNIIAKSGSENTYLYSEIFFSPQGEGQFTGKPTVWVRFFYCNLSCDGFGQDNPRDPSTYILPYKDFDVDSIKTVEDLPVFEYGCDSSYSWAKKYKHLAKRATAKEIARLICLELKDDSNPLGMFIHPDTHQSIHLAFTGGEPMLNQDAIVDIIEELTIMGNEPLDVTIETNGTQPLTDRFKNYTNRMCSPFFFSVSPKLFSVSGEPAKRAIKPEVVIEYSEYAHGQLKFVLSDDEQAWDELYSAIELFRNDGKGCDYPVWIMPVGATDSGQAKSAAAVAKRAIKKGFNVSARSHISLFGNVIGS